MHWKIARDRLYRPLYETLGLKGILEAGFFFDSTETDMPLDDVSWLCTPLSKIEQGTQAGRNVVLLSTGAFSPIHKGHIHMMESAKQSLLDRGENVIGGYLSLGHDGYVQQKLGAQSIPAAHRMWLCSLALETSSWLMVDPWEALARSTYVNLSDVYIRLLNYLHHHIDEQLDLVYVCGGDNAHLALAFAFFGRCVVVGRPDSEEHMMQMMHHPLLHKQSRILWVQGEDKASSTRIRAGHIEDAPSQFSHAEYAQLQCSRVSLRREDERVVASFDISSGCWHQFQQDIFSCFNMYFPDATFMHGEKQLREQTQERAITMDVWSDAPYRLEISRAFGLGGHMFLGHVPRPESASFPEQIARIPAGVYHLEDDDRMTGNTLRFARALLPQEIGITRERVCKEPIEHEEILDVRDFVFGGKYAGLVVQTPKNGYVRLPYVLPYVDPYRRCHIPPEHVLSFSIMIWECNRRLFASSASCVEKLPKGLQALLCTMGFDENDRIYDVIAWHIEHLKRIRGTHDVV